MINWSFSPSPESKVDAMRTLADRENYIYYHATSIFICIEEASYESGVYVTPDFWEPWEVETIIVQGKMKCWGRGLNKRL